MGASGSGSAHKSEQVVYLGRGEHTISGALIRYNWRLKEWIVGSETHVSAGGEVMYEVMHSRWSGRD